MKSLSSRIHHAPDPFVAAIACGSVPLCIEAPALERGTPRLSRSRYLFRHCMADIAAVGTLALYAVLSSQDAYARHDSYTPLSDEAWESVREKVSLLDNTVLIPSLLPVIMTNRDALGLREEQLARLNRWRRENYVNMVNLMNEVIQRRVQFQVESLSPGVSEAHLIVVQEDIQRLERELLKIRLSCRAIVMETFTREQWEAFEFLVADDPKLGSLISQRTGVSVAHDH